MGKYISDRTKHCRNLKILFSILHFLCLFGPFFYFVPYGFIISGTVEKIALSFTLITSLVLAMISLIVSVTAKAGLHRCIMWTLIAGLLFALQEIRVFIWIMAITSIIDELIFVKLKDYYKTILLSNREIDRRQ